jgi:hypothetical protein
MAKKKIDEPDLKVPIHFIPEKDKYEDPVEKSVTGKLTTNLAVQALPNSTTECLPIFNQGTVQVDFNRPWKYIDQGIIRT